MTKSKITKKEKDLIIIVEVTKSVTDKISYADGYNVNLRKATFQNITISLKKGDIKIYCRDINFFYVLSGRDKEEVRKELPTAYARLGDEYISENTYNLINQVKKEAENACVTSTEYNDTKMAEDLAKIKANTAEAEAIAEQVARSKSSGWCDECESYCYGDCAA